MIPDLDPRHGMLPPGRYRATRDEVYQRFVHGQGAVRERVWRDWGSATNLLCRHVPVNAAWLYGRFLSEDPEPDVVACVYWAKTWNWVRRTSTRLATPFCGPSPSGAWSATLSGSR